MLSIKDAAARVSNRISANNSLRFVCREPDLNARTFGGMLENQTTPNPIKPFVGHMVLVPETSPASFLVAAAAAGSPGAYCVPKFSSTSAGASTSPGGSAAG